MVVASVEDEARDLHVNHRVRVMVSGHAQDSGRIVVYSYDEEQVIDGAEVVELPSFVVGVAAAGSLHEGNSYRRHRKEVVVAGMLIVILRGLRMIFGTAHVEV